MVFAFSIIIFLETFLVKAFCHGMYRYRLYLADFCSKNPSSP